MSISYHLDTDQGRMVMQCERVSYAKSILILVDRILYQTKGRNVRQQEKKRLKIRLEKSR